MKRLTTAIILIMCTISSYYASAQQLGEIIPRRRESGGLLPAVMKRLSLSYDLNTLYPKDMDYVSFNGGGVAYNVDFLVSDTKPLYIGTGLDLRLTTRSKCYSHEFLYNVVNIKQRTTFFNANVPVDFSYRLPLFNTMTVMPFVGLNFRVQLIGHNRNRIKSGATPEELDAVLEQMNLGPADGNLFSRKDYGAAHLNRFQMGWRAGVRLQYLRVSLQLSYGSDFVKLHSRLGSSNLLISVGYSL